jgi:hypothetical protein
MHTRRARESDGQRGQTLVEIMIAIAFLTLTLCGITGSIVASDRLRGVNRETALAQQGVRAALEALNGVPFPTVFKSYNSTAGDDLFGVTSPGANFAVRGLSAVPGDPDGLPGEISFPTVDSGGVLLLREDVVDPGLGMPQDLNGDGIDLLDHSADYRVLPVRVRVRWSGATGVRVITMETILCAR